MEQQLVGRAILPYELHLPPIVPYTAFTYYERTPTPLATIRQLHILWWLFKTEFTDQLHTERTPRPEAALIPLRKNTLTERIGRFAATAGSPTEAK